MLKANSTTAQTIGQHCVWSTAVWGAGVRSNLGCGDWVQYAETAQPKWAYGFGGFLGIYY